MGHRDRELDVTTGTPWACGDGSALLSSLPSGVLSAAAWRVGPTLAVPETYCETYQYPLICVLHDHDRSERDLWQWFPEITDQNAIGLGIRAPFPARSGIPGQYRWRGQRPDASWGAISSEISEVTGEWNIHPDRIYLHGVGNGAVIALQQLLLSQLGPTDADFEIAGVSCYQLPGWWPRVLPPVSTELRGRLLFLDECRTPEEDAAIDALKEAGCSVMRTSSPSASPHQTINHWIMAGIGSTIW
ncbi:MAG TPA: hypothetical protein VNQ76_05340 [Planctomicrobium sp.]|nr:hypothetical protein [Planctomicrobium sp.]